MLRQHNFTAKQSKTDTDKIPILLSCLSVVFWLVVIGWNVWPGIYDSDSISYASIAMFLPPQECVNFWESWFYTYLLCKSFSVGIVFGLFCLLQVGIGLSLFAFNGFLILKTSVKYFLIANLIFCVFPFLGLSFFYLERDVLFALCSLLPTILLFKNGNDTRWGAVKIILCGALLGLASFLRIEGLLFLMVFPIQLFLLRGNKSREILLATVIVGIFAIGVPITEMSSVKSRKDRYSLNATLPWALHLYQNHKVYLDVQTVHIFEKVIDPQQIRFITSLYPSNIIRAEATAEDIYLFQKKSIYMIFRHPDAFIRKRLLSLSKGRHQLIGIPQEGSFDRADEVSMNKADQHITSVRSESSQYLPKFLDLKIAEKVNGRKTLSFFYFFGHYGLVLWLFAFISLIAMASMVKKNYFVAAIPSILQIIIFFLFAPSGNGKYLWLTALFSAMTAPWVFLNLRFSALLEVFPFRKINFAKDLSKVSQDAMKRYLKVFLSLLISLGCLLLLYNQDILVADFWSQNSSGFIWILLSVVAHAVTTLLASLRWRIILQAPALSLKDLFFISWRSQLTGMISLGSIGGDLHKILYLNQTHKISMKNGLKSCVWERLWGISGILFLVLFYYMIEERLFIQAVFLFIIPFTILRSRKIWLLTLANHIVKASLFYCILYFVFLFSGRLTDIFLVLLSEVFPLSIDGLGTSHLIAQRLFIVGGAKAYTFFFLGKVLFKILSLIVWKRIRRTEGATAIK